MSDPFNSPSPQLADPVDHAFSISPHATNPIAFTTRAIYVGVGYTAANDWQEAA